VALTKEVKCWETVAFRHGLLLSRLHRGIANAVH